MSESRPCRNSRQCRGAVLIAVIVCLAVVGMMLATMASRMMLAHRQLRHEAAYQQAYWLCEAGIERATYRMRAGDEYAGESWQISSTELGNRGAAEVMITVGESSVESEKKIRVIARYPLHEVTEMRCCRTVSWSPSTLDHLESP